MKLEFYHWLRLKVLGFAIIDFIINVMILVIIIDTVTFNFIIVFVLFLYFLAQMLHHVRQITVSILWFHEPLAPLVKVCERESTKWDCNVSRGDIQCDWRYPNSDDGFLCCRFQINHPLPHEDAYGYTNDENLWYLPSE